MTQPQPQLALRPFQEEEAQRVSARKRCGIIWHMGLGKTSLASTVGGRAHLRKWLIIAPTNAFSVWRDDAPRWIKHAWPEAEVYVHLLDVSAEEREVIWNFQPPSDSDLTLNRVDLFVCTIESFLNDWSKRIKVRVPGKLRPQTLLSLKARPNYYFPQIVIFDEARKMRNRKSQAYQIVAKFIGYYNTEYFLPMTGTPGNQPQHFYAMLSIIEPKLFSSFWKFVDAFHYVFDTPFGKEIGMVRNEEQWWKTLNRYCSVIKETDPGVSKQLPALQRLALEIDLDADQKKAYRALEKDMLHITEGGEVVVASTTLSLITRLRQILICPRILGESLDVGAAIRDFADTVDPDDLGHYVIFTPFTEAMRHFREYLTSPKGGKFEPDHVYSLFGGLTAGERDNILAEYKQPSSKSKAKVMLCSLLYAQAFSLEPATKCFFAGFDWDPDNNRQAEARLRRLTSEQQVPITAYYYNFPKYEAARRMHEIVVLKQERLQITIPDDLRKLFSKQEQEQESYEADIGRGSVRFPPTSELNP